MRIAFTGTHQVGKTTLAEAIADRLPGYELIREPYLELEEAGYVFSAIPELEEYIAQFEFALKQLETCGTDVLFDRCPLDLLAYIQAVDPSNNTAKFYNDMLRSLWQIDLLVFVPIETPDIRVCLPADLPELRNEVNEIVQDLSEDLDTPILVVNGSLDSRIDQVLAYVTNTMI